MKNIFVGNLSFNATEDAGSIICLKPTELWIV